MLHKNSSSQDFIKTLWWKYWIMYTNYTMQKTILHLNFLEAQIFIYTKKQKDVISNMIIKKGCNLSLSKTIFGIYFHHKVGVNMYATNPLLICTVFLKYPFWHLFQTEIKIDFKTNWKIFPVQTGFLLPV